MKKLTAALLLLAANTNIANAQNVVLNEVMQSNIDYLMVEKDFPDSWVELYNPSDQQVNLSGYRLGEKNIFDKAYKLPSTATIEPKGHILIYCDKENRGLHTDFRVDAGKATLFLFDSKGNAIDSLSLKDMPAANIAYGRKTDGAGEWHYEITPSAGAANESEGSDLLLPEPVFSVKGCVVPEFSGIFPVTISIPEGVELPSDTRLYITDDGSEPTLSSRSFPQSFTFNLTSTSVVRAKLISSHALSRRSTTQSYIFHPRQLNLPVVSIVTNRDYIYGNDYGIVSGAVNDGKPNYMQKWRRPLNIEYYDMRTSGNVVFNQLCETAVSGVSTREQPQKSLKVYANKRFEKKTFKGPFWSDKPEVTKVKSFVLRSGGNNSFTTRINDAAVQKLFGAYVEDDLDWQAYQPVVVYINGTYAGEYGMRERSNEDFVESNYDLSDVEIADETSYQRPAKGSLFESFWQRYRSNTVTYAELLEQMDMDNFIATLVAEMYAMNTDYPTNNISLWRPTAEGGKWRWILKDLDRAGQNIAMYPADFDMFRYLFTPDDLQYAGIYNFDLYTRLVSFPEFRERFIDVMSVQLGDFLRPEFMSELIDNMVAEVQSELKPTFYAYNCITEWSKFNTNIKNLKKFFANRPSYLYSQMASHFELGPQVPLVVNNESSSVSINGQALRTPLFSGSYFTERNLLLDSDLQSHQWQLTLRYANGTSTETILPNSSLSLRLADHIDASQGKLLSAEFSPVDAPSPGEDTSISHISTTAPSSSAYTLQGTQLPAHSQPQHSIIVREGKKVLMK